MVDLGFWEIYDASKHGPYNQLSVHRYIVVRKGNSFREVVDLRDLNANTIPESFESLPTLQECIRPLVGCHAFTKGDAESKQRSP